MVKLLPEGRIKLCKDNNTYKRIRDKGLLSKSGDKLMIKKRQT
jgi:hypothetical protein